MTRKHDKSSLEDKKEQIKKDIQQELPDLSEEEIGLGSQLYEQVPSPRPDFQAQLKSRLLEAHPAQSTKRPQKESSDKPGKLMANFQPVVKFVGAMAAAFVVGVLLWVYASPFGDDGYDAAPESEEAEEYAQTYDTDEPEDPGDRKAEPESNDMAVTEAEDVEEEAEEEAEEEPSEHDLTMAEVPLDEELVEQLSEIIPEALPSYQVERSTLSGRDLETAYSEKVDDTLIQDTDSFPEEQLKKRVHALLDNLETTEASYQVADSRVIDRGDEQKLHVDVHVILEGDFILITDAQIPKGFLRLNAQGELTEGELPVISDIVETEKHERIPLENLARLLTERDIDPEKVDLGYYHLADNTLIPVLLNVEDKTEPVIIAPVIHWP